MPSETEVAWLAGLLEGEGCFTTASDHRTPRSRDRLKVHLKMTDEDVVQRAVAVFPSSQKIRRSGPSGSPGVDTSSWSDVFAVEWTGYRAEALMRLVRPYMGKRRGARIDELLAMTNLSHHPREAS